MTSWERYLFFENGEVKGDMNDYVDKNIYSTFNSRKNTSSKGLMEEEEEEYNATLNSTLREIKEKKVPLIVTT